MTFPYNSHAICVRIAFVSIETRIDGALKKRVAFIAFTFAEACGVPVMVATLS